MGPLKRVSRRLGGMKPKPVVKKPGGGRAPVGRGPMKPLRQR